jgi:D-psicose/D-tagatose/L-ribulose 3-epimerase
MRLAISNIAWSNEQDGEILALMQKYGFAGLEIAPSKIWSSPANVAEHEIISYSQSVKERGIQPVGIQSALFGHPELILFSTEELREQLYEYLTQMIKACSWLDGKVLVFGNPKNRQRGNLSLSEAEQIAVPFFRRLGEFASKHHVIIGLEPNSVDYGTDFMTNTDETLRIVEQVNHVGVQFHMDLGVLQSNNEPIARSIEKAMPYMCHFHVSQPLLKPFSANDAHLEAADALRRFGYNNWVSIEMLTGQENVLAAVEDGLREVSKIYG